jgi:hypothetical protein
MVTPDPGDEPWPSTRFLRQGVRANAWVLLNRVSLGFEIWRQFNGFPPTLTNMPSTSPTRSSAGWSSSYGGGSYGGGAGSAYGGGAGSAYGGGGGHGDEGDGY